MQKPITTVSLIKGGTVIKQGHYFTLEFNLFNADGELVDTSGMSIKFKIAYRVGGVVHEGTATIIGKGHISITVKEDIGRGDMRVEFTATKGSDVQKFPSEDFVRLRLTPSLDDLTHTGVNTITVEQFQRIVDKAVDDSKHAVTVADDVKNQFDQVVAEAGSNNPEVVQARGGEVNLNERFNKVTSQLADKANQLQVENQLNQMEIRVADVVQSADLDPNKDQEVVDARNGKATLGIQIRELVDKVETEKYADLSSYESPALLSVPVISDTITGYNWVHNVAETVLSDTKFAGIVTTFTNFDIVYTTPISGAKLGTGGVIGQTIVHDKNGNEIKEGGVTDNASNVGKHALTTTGAIWLMVPKGTYATIADARLNLGNVKLKYQLKDPYETELPFVPQPTILSVPSASDTYDAGTSTITKRIKGITLSDNLFAGLLTSYVNVDVVYTSPIAGAKKGTGGMVGQTTLKDKSGSLLSETTPTDNINNIGKHAITTLGAIWIFVPKGKYSNIANARADLGEMELKYQLETPTTHNYEAGYRVDLLKNKNFTINTKGNSEDTINFINVPAFNNNIFSVTLNVNYAVETDLIFRNNIRWRNGKKPVFEVGKKYLLLFITYDNGVTWFGSLGGEF